MNILIIGSGGREHAIAQILTKTSSNHKLFVAPGNAGIQQIADCITIDLADNENLLKFCINQTIEFIIIGPEQPIADGLSDKIRN